MIVDFARKCRGVYSDGDLDGIFATGLLLKALNGLGLSLGFNSVFFPHPRLLKDLSVDDSILIELPPSKGLKYNGVNILFDHHGGYSGVISYKGCEVSDVAEVSGESVAEIVVKFFGLELGEDGFRMLDAVNRVDSGRYGSELSENLHKAFRLEIASEEMRYRLSKLVYSSKWNEIQSWAFSSAKKWDMVEVVEDKLVSSAITIGDAAVFVYDGFNDLELAAMRGAMFKLEEKYPIVFAVRVENGKAVSASIASMKGVDLTHIYSRFIELGFTAGGRKMVGGVQFNGIDVKEALKIIKNLLNQ